MQHSVEFDNELKGLLSTLVTYCPNCICRCSSRAALWLPIALIVLCFYSRALQQCAAGAVTRTWAVAHLCSMFEFNGVYLSRVVDLFPCIPLPQSAAFPNGAPPPSPHLPSKPAARSPPAPPPLSTPSTPLPILPLPPLSNGCKRLDQGHRRSRVIGDSARVTAENESYRKTVKQRAEGAAFDACDVLPQLHLQLFLACFDCFVFLLARTAAMCRGGSRASVLHGRVQRRLLEQGVSSDSRRREGKGARGV